MNKEIIVFQIMPLCLVLLSLCIVWIWMHWNTTKNNIWTFIIPLVIYAGLSCIPYLATRDVRWLLGGLILLVLGSVWALMFWLTKNSPWTFIVPVVIFLGGMFYIWTKNFAIFLAMSISIITGRSVYLDIKNNVKTRLKGISPEGWLLLCFGLSYCLPTSLFLAMYLATRKWNIVSFYMFFFIGYSLFILYYLASRRKELGNSKPLH